MKWQIFLGIFSGIFNGIFIGIFNGIFSGIFIGILGFSGTALAQNQLHFEETNPISRQISRQISGQMSGQRAALGILEGLQAQEQNQQPERKNKEFPSPASTNAAPGPLSFRATLEDLAARWPRPLGDAGLKVYDTKVILLPGEEQSDMREYLNAKDEKLFAAVGRINCFDQRNRARNFSTATVVGNRKTLLAVRHFSILKRPSREAPHFFHPSQCRFYLYNAKGKKYFSSKLSIAHSGTEDPKLVYTNRKLDWTVLTLKNPVPNHILPISIQPINKGELTDLGPTILIGYHGDTTYPTRKLVSQYCSPEIRYRSSNVIAHFCDTGGGSSGALIYKLVKGHPLAMAMNISEHRFANENRALLFGPQLQAGLKSQGVVFGEEDLRPVDNPGIDNPKLDNQEEILRSK